VLSPQILLNVFRSVDDVLTEIEELVLASRAHSPFNEYLTQLSEEQNRVVSNGIAELRTGMLCILRHHGLPTNNPTIQTANALQKLVAEAASRFDDLDIARISDPSHSIDNETSRFLLQMKNTFVHMDRTLSADSTQSERRLNQ
jgi:hypothetical protein